MRGSSIKVKCDRLAQFIVQHRTTVALGVALIMFGVAMNYLGISDENDDIRWTDGLSVTSLRRDIAVTRKAASEAGALHPIATTYQILPDSSSSVEFIVSQIDKDNYRQKPIPKPADGGGGAGVDPFADGNREPLLTVTEIGADHVLMLNKFNTMVDHVLLIAKGEASQADPLTSSDLRALMEVAHTTPAVGFFNSAAEAGASQPHKHLQAIPEDVLRAYNPPSNTILPIDPLINALPESHRAGEPLEVPGLEFLHRLVFLDPDHATNGDYLLNLYHKALKAANCHPRDGPAYNLVLTTRWMMVVPRSRREFMGVDVNAMGFLGALLVRDGDILEEVKSAGPMAILEGVGIPRPSE